MVDKKENDVLKASMYLEKQHISEGPVVHFPQVSTSARQGMCLCVCLRLIMKDSRIGRGTMGLGMDMVKRILYNLKNLYAFFQAFHSDTFQDIPL